MTTSLPTQTPSDSFDLHQKNALESSSESPPKNSFSFDAIRLRWPTAWDTLFGRSAPLIVEIGFGGGNFLMDLAQRHPHANVVGIEHSHHCLTDVEALVLKQHAANIRLIRFDARAALAYLFAPATMDMLYINFPDPFPKKAHEQRRLLSPETLTLIASRLKPGALLTIATDVDAYAESIAADLAQTAGLINRHATPWLTTLPGRVTTRYERKAHEHGATCHYFEWERTTEVLPLPPVRDAFEEIMPNVVLHSPLSLTAIAEAFQPLWHDEADVHVHLLAVYYNPSDRGLLIESFIDEPLLEQRPAIAVAKRDVPNRYVVRLSSIGHPRPTPGVHIAVRMITNWICSLHPDSEILYDAVKDT